MAIVGRIFAAVALFAGINLSTNAGSIEDAISERLAPPGSVCVEGTDCAAATAGPVAPAGPRSGETVYNTACLACHTTGAGGAPMIGDAGAWAARLANGIDTVYANAINGINAMPARGACMDCSDDEIKETIDYILANSQ